MTISLKHSTTVAVPDNPAYPVGSSEYNAEHATSMATNKLVGRASAGPGAFEEITLGANLSLAGATLNATGGSPGGSSQQIQYNNAGALGGFTLGGDATLVASTGILTISAQTVTYAKMQNTSTANVLLGRGSAAGAGSPQEIVLGTNLSLSGTTLNATGGAVAVNAQTGTAYTLQTSDNGKIVTLNNASAITLTCPVALGAAFSCLIIQLGVGQVNVVAGAGAVLHSYTALTHLSGQYAMGTIAAPTADNFILGGQIS